MELLRPKVAIIGCGAVGMSYAYALTIRGGARQLVLVDVDMRKVEGEAMDLSHGAPYFPPVEIVAGGYADIAGADIVVVTAGKKQKPGQTRIDLAKDNVRIMREIIPEIMKHAPDAILLVASNPVDVLAYAAYKFSGKPWQTVIGSGTVLDSARLRFELASHCNVDPRNIHAYILGEHGDTEFPYWSKALIGSALFAEYCNICETHTHCNHNRVLNDIFVRVRDSAYKIIERKGVTSFGIGLALVRITETILNNENSILPVSALLRGYRGIEDVYLSLPAVVNRGGIRDVLKVELSPDEEKALQRSADALKATIKEVGLYEQAMA